MKLSVFALLLMIVILDNTYAKDTYTRELNEGTDLKARYSGSRYSSYRSYSSPSYSSYKYKGYNNLIIDE